MVIVLVTIAAAGDGGRAVIGGTGGTGSGRRGKAKLPVPEEESVKDWPKPDHVAPNALVIERTHISATGGGVPPKNAEPDEPLESVIAWPKPFHTLPFQPSPNESVM
jgi:hypothetical protein